MSTIVKQLFSQEEGQGMVEYGLVVGLIAVVLIGALTAMTGGLASAFTKISSTLTGVDSGGSGSPD